MTCASLDRTPMAEISTRQCCIPGDSALAAAFEQTDYLVLDQHHLYSVRTGCPTPPGLTRKCRGRSWAIVTADNPAAIRASGIRNRRAGQRLYRMLSRTRPLLLPTMHRSRDGSWPDEFGWLVCPAPPAKAVRIGRIFGQLAVVIGGPGRCAEIAECCVLRRHNSTGDYFHPKRRVAS